MSHNEYKSTLPLSVTWDLNEQLRRVEQIIADPRTKPAKRASMVKTADTLRQAIQRKRERAS